MNKILPILFFPFITNVLWATMGLQSDEKDENIEIVVKQQDETIGEYYAAIEDLGNEIKKQLKFGYSFANDLIAYESKLTFHNNTIKSVREQIVIRRKIRNFGNIILEIPNFSNKELKEDISNGLKGYKDEKRKCLDIIDYQKTLIKRIESTIQGTKHQTKKLNERIQQEKEEDIKDYPEQLEDYQNYLRQLEETEELLKNTQTNTDKERLMKLIDKGELIKIILLTAESLLNNNQFIKIKTEGGQKEVIESITNTKKRLELQQEKNIKKEKEIEQKLTAAEKGSESNALYNQASNLLAGDNNASEQNYVQEEEGELDVYIQTQMKKFKQQKEHYCQLRKKIKKHKRKPSERGKSFLKQRKSRLIYKGKIRDTIISIATNLLNNEKFLIFHNKQKKNDIIESIKKTKETLERSKPIQIKKLDALTQQIKDINFFTYNFPNAMTHKWFMLTIYVLIACNIIVQIYYRKAFGLLKHSFETSSRKYKALYYTTRIISFIIAHIPTRINTKYPILLIPYKVAIFYISNYAFDYLLSLRYKNYKYGANDLANGTTIVFLFIFTMSKFFLSFFLPIEFIASPDNAPTIKAQQIIGLVVSCAILIYTLREIIKRNKFIKESININKKKKE